MRFVNSGVYCYNAASLLTSGHCAHTQYRKVPMASKKGNRIIVKLRSTESGHMYTTEKNRKNDPSRLELKRYDPLVRRHVVYRESK